MTQIDERLVLAIEANTKQLERGMRRVEKVTGQSMRKTATHVSSLDRRMKAAAATARNFGRAFVAGIVGAGATGALRALRDLVGEASRLAKDARNVGLVAEEYQRLQFGFEIAGVEASNFSKSMEQLNRRLTEAQTGTGNLKKILDANNISLFEADGTLKNTSRLLREYADLIKNAESSQNRLYLATEAFGRSGTQMALALMNGASGVRELEQEASRAGGVLDAELLRKAEDIDDQWTRLARTFSVTVKGAILDVLAALHSAEREVTSGELVRQAITDIEGRAASLRRELALANVNQDTSRAAELEADIDRIETRLQSLQQQATTLDAGLSYGPPRRGGRRRAAPVTAIPTTPTRSPSGGSGGGTVRRNAAQQVIDQLRFEAEQLGRTSQAQDLYNRLQQAGVDINSEAGQKIADLVEANHSLRDAQEAAASSAERASDIQRQFGRSAVSALSDVVIYGGDAEAAMARLAQSIADAALQAALLDDGPLADLFGGGGVGAAKGGKVKGGGGLGSILSSVFAGFFADGGRIPRGQFGIVGEAGPEFVSGPAMVTPMGGGTRVQVNVINRGEPVDAQIGGQRQTAGGVEIDVVIDRITARKATDPASNLNRALTRGLGLGTPLSR